MRFARVLRTIRVRALKAHHRSQVSDFGVLQPRQLATRVTRRQEERARVARRGPLPPLSILARFASCRARASSGDGASPRARRRRCRDSAERCSLTARRGRSQLGRSGVAAQVREASCKLCIFLWFGLPLLSAGTAVVFGSMLAWLEVGG